MATAFTSLILRVPLRGVPGGDGMFGCLSDKVGTSHVCIYMYNDGSTLSSGYICSLYAFGYLVSTIITKV